MKEPRKTQIEKERQLIVLLHDNQNYSFSEIAKMPQFNVTAQAIHKRYKKAKGLTEG